MDIFLEIVKITIPLLILSLVVFYTIKIFLENDQKKRLLEMRLNAKSTITPIRLQAYERMAMYLERIEPHQLVIRLNNPQLNVYQLQTLLISSIRSEFEHNLSQQVYISSEAWDKIKKAKEETIRLVNLSAGKLKAESPGIELATAILEQAAAYSPTEEAMRSLKNEIQAIF